MHVHGRRSVQPTPYESRNLPFGNPEFLVFQQFCQSSARLRTQLRQKMSAARAIKASKLKAQKPPELHLC